MKKAYRLTSAQELAQVFLHHIQNIANQKQQYIFKSKKKYFKPKGAFGQIGTGSFLDH